MKLGAMLRVRMAWAAHQGPLHEVVLSSRVRLARNVRGLPFPGHASGRVLGEVLAAAREAAAKARSLGKAAWIELADVDEVDREFLIERRLISALLAREPRQRAVAVGERELLSVMVNEEDHLRLQAVDSGLCLEELLRHGLALEEELGRTIPYAVHPRLRHLTACPTNVGTGLRASCLMHLPALSLTGRLGPLLDELAPAGMTARGIHGEGTQVLGDLYQISNAVTLGHSEARIVAAVSKRVEALARRELDARRGLAAPGARARAEDLVWRSIGLLANARSMPYAEAVQHLSWARMASTLGWKAPASLAAINELILLTQPAHVQMLTGRPLDPVERDVLRAALLRKKFS
ncbi:MAG TPA: ATP--guanido phosphotransferase [Elusimicrobiota bacterium]|jgi:protein arginine kinase|nr:ATP--guanido phosphotransferase [Elusimicrobiota bacterium]